MTYKSGCLFRETLIPDLRKDKIREKDRRTDGEGDRGCKGRLNLVTDNDSTISSS